MATPISSAPPPFVPVRLDPSKDSDKEAEGTSAHPEKASGADQTERQAEEVIKKSKARQRDSEAKGKWWPCTTTDMELRNLETEGFLQHGSWRSIPNELAPAPKDDEMVRTKALVERGFSFPPSDFFLEILKTYGLQPHNISPNGVLAICNHVTLCEGHLRVTPELSLFQYYFTVKKERIRQSTELATCGSITFMIRPGRVYPPTDRHESASGSAEEGLTGKDLTLSGSSGSSRSNTGPPDVPIHGRDDPMRATKDNLSADALDKRIRLLIKIPRELHVHVCNKDIHTNGSGTAPAIQHFFKPSGQPPKAPRVPKKRAKPSPASIPVTPEVEVPPKASSASKPDPKDVINLDDLPEDPAHHGDSAKGTSSSVPPQDQPSTAFVEPTEEEQEQKVKLLQVTNATRVDPRPTPSLQKLTLAQRHAEVSTMLNKVWGKPDEEMRELADLEDGLEEFFAKHKEVRQTTRKLHEDLRVHVLEQITEIEGLRQNAENSQKAIQLLETRLQEETAKHSKFDELSAKVKVLEAENESLKTFIQESSNKETQARKELSEKHTRVLADLNEKLEKSQGRVISLVAKNKVLEAEAEAVDQLIFPSLGFEWSKESNLKRTEAYDEARISIDALFEACRRIAKTLSLKKAKTTVIDTMTNLMEQVPDFIKDWQRSSARGVASLVLATCKAHFPSLNLRMLHAEPPRVPTWVPFLRKPKAMSSCLSSE
ncbi:hypothetical protein QYE76_059067 [Lolium multiflorum]|uniref:Transposase (putative) gypsy type domain-containing protein n=1 Tax=Lolium multiflorum TaxID=4521 RepID=A0AAD8T8A0_LOLMU|nr:hypothetical protein QYE76_059067 [Lolium multiflorum]